MSESIKVSVKLPVKPREVYEAWLDSDKHSAFAGKEVKIERKVGSAFSIDGGEITGENLKLYRFNKIVQSWRSVDFPEDAEDSIVTILLDEIPEGTKLTVQHEKLPDGDSAKYRKGWRDYFKPMKEYFSQE